MPVSFPPLRRFVLTTLTVGCLFQAPAAMAQEADCAEVLRKLELRQSVAERELSGLQTRIRELRQEIVAAAGSVEGGLTLPEPSETGAEAALPSYAQEDPAIPADCEDEGERLLTAAKEAELRAARARAYREVLDGVLDGPQVKTARYNALVKKVAEETARLRGLELKEPVTPKVLDADGLAGVLKMLLDEELTDAAVRGTEVTWKGLGLIPEDADLRILYGGLLEGQVGGLYDDRRKTLYVVDVFDPTSFFGKVILCHEITHAIQDQHFPIADLPFRTENDDQNLAMACVLEGDATMLMMEWGMENGSLAAIMKDIPALLKQNMDQLNETPPALVQMLLFPYLGGMEFYTEMGYIGPGAARNRPFEQPPVSTEQILHPEKYQANERPIADYNFPAAESLAQKAERLGLEQVYLNTLGEWITRVWLVDPANFPSLSLLNPNFMVKDPAATAAAAGWGNDRIVTFASDDGDRWLFEWTTVWDTEADSKEFFGAAAARLGLEEKGTYAKGESAVVFFSPNQTGHHVVVVTRASDKKTFDDFLAELRKSR
ncbi:MAG: hypothetical protein RLY93_14205 [Sumerlaeia bacterium]